MTVPLNPNTRTTAVGNGVSVAFPFDFLCLEARDLQVSVGDVMLAPSQYSVSGLGELQGGEVTFVTAPGSGVPILMELSVVAARAIDYQDNGDLFARTVNLDFDRLWLAIKTGYGRQERALVLGPYDVDGQGSYRANNNRIQDLGDPLESQDAVNRRWVQEQLANLATDGSGQFVLDMLAEQNDPNMGAGLVGFKGTTLYDFMQDARPYIVSRAVAITRQITPNVQRALLGGYNAEGDVDPMWFSEIVNSGTVQPWQFQSNGGSRRWGMAARVTVRPEHFGAKGDGTTDDAAAIQAAVNFCSSIGGGRVEFWAPIYRIGQSILGKTGVSMVSVRPYGTTLEIPQNATAGGGLSSHPLAFVGQSNFEVFGVGVRGNRAISPVLTSFGGIYLEACNNFDVHHVIVRDTQMDGIILTQSVNGHIGRNSVTNTNTGINLFKGNIDVDVERNRVDQCRLNGVMSDDATSADVTPGTSSPNFRIRFRNNAISNYSLDGSSYGMVVSGQQDGEVIGNTIVSGGVLGANAGASKTASAIVINSGQDTYNKAEGIVVTGNQIRTVVGGAGLTLQGAHRCVATGNTMVGLFVWPTTLSGAAINVLEDVAGAHTVAIQRTQRNRVESNTIEGNANTSVGVQLGAGTLANSIGNNPCIGVTTGELSVSATAGQGQLTGRYYGALPSWNAGWRGAQWHSVADDKLYIGTNSAWVVAGTQT